MRVLIPEFIISNYKQHKFSGIFDAYVISVDLIGFTFLTQELMSHSHAGVEILTDTINAVFSPAIQAVHSRGGFIAGFAGDAFTVIFPNDGITAVLSAAMEVRDSIKIQGKQITQYGEFEIASRIGVAYGKVEWKIVQSESQSAFWFSGEGIIQAVIAQSTSQTNEVTTTFTVDEKNSQSQFTKIPFHTNQEVQPDSAIKLYRLDKYTISAGSAKEDIVHSYSDFLPESVTGLTSEGEFREVLSCFINLESPTEEQVLVILNAVQKYGGYFSHIDCTDKGWVAYIMFGAPLNYERIQQRAMNFAFELQGSFREQARIGLTQGMAFAGFIGSRSRSVYTGIGMTVNLSARYMLKADWGEIWCDHPIQAALKNDFAFADLGEISLKGYPNPIRTYKLLGREQSKAHSHYQSSFIGREQELKDLTNSCDLLFDHQFAHVSYIYGTAGQGKSRLVFELTQLLGDRVSSFFLQTDSIHRSPLNPFAHWIRQLFTTELTGSIESRRTDFRIHWAGFIEKTRNISLAVYPSLIKELERIESVLAGLIGLEWEGSIYADLDPKYRSSVTGFALRTLLETLTLDKPVVLIIEDLHWLDKESEETITILTRRANNVPFKFILTSRPLDDGSKPVLKLDKDVNTTSTDLDGLNKQQVMALIEEILQTPPGEEFTEYILSISQGNPFLVEQLVCYLEESGKLHIVQGLYQLKEQTEVLPMGVQSLLVARLDRLEVELKRTVQTASVLGCEFAVEILKEMLETLEQRPEYLNELIVQSQLHAGEQEHIWNAISEIKYIFSHSLLREAAYEMQLKRQIKSLHYLAAQIIEKHYVEDNTRLGELARHFDKAGEWEKAVQYYNRVGEYEKRQFHFESSISYYESALFSNRQFQGEKHVATAESYHDIGSVYCNMGEYDKALEYYQKSLAIRQEVYGERHPETAKILNNIGIAYDYKGIFDKAYQYFQQALSIRLEAFGEENQETSVSYNNIGSYFKKIGNFDKSFEFHQKALSIQQKIWGVDHLNTALSLNSIGMVYYQKAAFDQALDYSQKALSILKDNLGNHHPNITGSLNNIGCIHMDRAEFDKALEYLFQALSINKDTLGERHPVVALNLFNIGNAYRNMKNYEQAKDYYELALSIRREKLGEQHPKTIESLEFLDEINKSEKEELA